MAIADGVAGVIRPGLASKKELLASRKSGRLPESNQSAQLCVMLCAITLSGHRRLRLSIAVIHCQPRIAQTPSRAPVLRHLRLLASLAVRFTRLIRNEEALGDERQLVGTS